AKTNTICVIDDNEEFNALLCATLMEMGYEILSYPSAVHFLDSGQCASKNYDLIITDVNMPGMTGHELCRRIRAEHGEEHIPIIMLTGNDVVSEKALGLNVGADDFIQKPFRSQDLLAKIQSLLKIHAQSQAKVGRLSRFISPNIADLVLSDPKQKALAPHRAEVTVMFIDLRAFTAFSERAEPEEVMQVLNRYYTAVGNAAVKHHATLGHLAGDGIMLFLNDPTPIPNHQMVGVHLALEIREALAPQVELWEKRNYQIDFGIGLAEGYATMGGIGFEQFWQYSVIGPVANFASRLCSTADHGQILVSRRFLERMDPSQIETEVIGAISLKGIPTPVDVHNVLSLDETKQAAKIS
ncbi:MAG: adenylate/guanylate cyclase domain-containing protein, partial [Bdellovibrionales bacterium]